MEEKRHVLEILQETKKAIEEREVSKIKDLSDKTIHSSAIYQQPEYVSIAVLIYSINKVLERKNYKEYSGYDGFLENAINRLYRAIDKLEKDKEEEFREEIKKLRRDTEKTAGDFKKHIKRVFEKASINKASRVYEHGISMERTANLLGISSWDLANYVGKTGIPEVNLNKTMTAKKRAKTALKLFN